MRKYLLFVLFISNFCFGQEYRDYNAPTLTKSTDNPNTVILRYNFTIRRDSIIKPDLFEVYFTLTEESINSYHKRKYYSYVIGIDSAYKKLIKHLLLLKIDTSGIKTVAITDKGNNGNVVYKNFNNKIIYLRIKSPKDVELVRDSIRFSGLDGIKANGYVTQLKDTIEQGMLRKSLIKADKAAEVYAKSQGLKVKIREDVSTTYYSSQKNLNGAVIYTNDSVNLDDIIYTLYLTVTYVLE